MTTPGFVHPTKKRKTLSFHDYEEEPIEIVEAVESKGFTVKLPEKPEYRPVSGAQFLKGKKICVAGRLTRSRGQYEEDIRRFGGIFTKNVSKDVIPTFVHLDCIFH